MSTSSSRRQPWLTPTIRSSSSTPSILSAFVTSTKPHLSSSKLPSVISTCTSLVSRSAPHPPSIRRGHPYAFPPKAELDRRKARSAAASAPPKHQSAHKREWRSWQKFIAHYGYATLPTADSLSSYLEWRADQLGSAGELKEVLAGVEWYAAPAMDHWAWEGVKRHAIVRRVMKGRSEVEKEERAGRITSL